MKNLAGWLCAAGLAFAAPAVAQTFSGSADVVEVEVPVQVVRDGQPVRGLTAGDFELYEGRKKLACRLTVEADNARSTELIQTQGGQLATVGRESTRSNEKAAATDHYCPAEQFV